MKGEQHGSGIGRGTYQEEMAERARILKAYAEKQKKARR